MARLLQHPRCKDFSPFSQSSMILEYITVNAKYNNTLSLEVENLLNSLRKHSFYKAIEKVSDITNSFERTLILQIIYSAVTYAENNHYANLIKLWIDDIYIKKVPKLNRFISKNSERLEYKYFIIINLGFEYKPLPIKKESLW